MSGHKWVEINEDMSAAFSLPCKENYYYMRHVGLLAKCDKPNDRHGHIELSCEDGYAFVPFCCYSMKGVLAVVERLSTLTKSQHKGILDLEEVCRLPIELTEEEKLIIDSPAEMKEQAKIYGWWS